jgi:hypothetical protein
MSDVQGINFVDLRQNMTASFSLTELDVLCFDLGISAGDVPGPELAAKVIQIIGYCQRRGPLLFNLIDACEAARPYVQWRQSVPAQVSSPVKVEDRSNHRAQLYKTAKDIQMVHSMVPSKEKEHYWDILIYLVHHESKGLSEVDYAEFFLGRYWGDQIFRVKNQDDFVGILISAYGPALCTCRVVFTDGKEVMLDRYIDFEMTNFFPPTKSEETAVLPPTLSINPAKLAQLINENFGGAELATLTFGLNMAYEDVARKSKAETIDGLVTHVKRNNRLSELLTLCQQERPYIQWDKEVQE